MRTMLKEVSVDKCVHCGKLYISPAYVCAGCGSEEFRAERIDGRGHIYTHTIIRVAPEAFRNQVPYPMAVIELAHGLRLTVRLILEEGETMEIGNAVGCLRQDDAGYWFGLLHPGQ
ncbi:MAG: OB-fold domain-containing protein [Deltaproteobacteria bacterium]|nr:OB-fold domain-containing protein [Deltaproteobacteria bacterium]